MMSFDSKPAQILEVGKNLTEFSRECRAAIRELESLISAPCMAAYERLVTCEARETLLKHIAELDHIRLLLDPVEEDIPF